VNLPIARLLLIALLALAGVGGRAATQLSAAARSEPVVETRATVRSTFEEDGGRRFYIRLKLVPRGKLPFTTITYRVLDRGLVAHVREGDNVAFRAQRIDGENVLTALRAVAPCERFARCE
jgi:Cu/Ag efflux protein CusF